MQSAPSHRTSTQFPVGIALCLASLSLQPAFADEGAGWMNTGQDPASVNATAPAQTPPPSAPEPARPAKPAKAERGPQEAPAKSEGSKKAEGEGSKEKPEGAETDKGAKEGVGEGEEPRRGKPLPLDDVFPVPEFPGPLIGVSGDAPLYPLTKALWDADPGLKNANIRVYGWLEPSYNVSTSSRSNFPLSYGVYANRFELSESVLRVERVPNTVQTDQVDYGFRVTSLYGIDYRFTTAQGIFSNQLLKSNNLYGYDPVEAYFQLYLPKAAQGMVLTIGRYISPSELEAPLSPMNFLVTHSLMNTATPATFTGIKSEVKLDDSWSLMGQIDAGGDVAPWNAAARVSGGLMIRWVSNDNRNSIWAGVNSVNGASFNDQHDQVNQIVGTYTHKLNDTFNTMTEVYSEYVRNGFIGGTVNNGPPYPWFSATGQGAFLPGTSNAVGVANFLNVKLSKKDYLSFRADYLNDSRGERLGVPCCYGGLAIGAGHNFSQLFTIRPEVRYDTCFTPGVTPFDGGTKKSQTSLNLDAILHF